MLRAMATKAAPLQLVTYRGMLHAEGCTLSGRVLRRPLHGGPRSDDGWWRNLRNTWRRFDSAFRSKTPSTFCRMSSIIWVMAPPASTLAW